MSWSIIITAANREKRLTHAFTEARVSAFLPLKRTWRGKYARHAEIKRPVVPGYVFAILQPHEIHAFHNDGAIRILTASRHEQAKLDACINGWAQDMANGAFDDPEPATKTKPLRARNRKTRRARRDALAWEDGLKAILAEISEPRQEAA